MKVTLAGFEELYKRLGGQHWHDGEEPMFTALGLKFKLVGKETKAVAVDTDPDYNTVGWVIYDKYNKVYNIELHDKLKYWGAPVYIIIYSDLVCIAEHEQSYASELVAEGWSIAAIPAGTASMEQLERHFKDLDLHNTPRIFPEFLMPPKQKVEELTVREIEKRLGYKVKVISDDKSLQ